MAKNIITAYILNFMGGNVFYESDSEFLIYSTY
jgi:hypothetical protein